MLGLKGEELNAKVEEFDRTHVPEIVTRFEAPITESHFKPEDASFRRGSSAPIEETELKIEQASFLPKSKTTKKPRRSVSEKPTRASTPAKAATPAPSMDSVQEQQRPAPAFDFTNFSFDAAPLHMAPAPIDPVFPAGLTIDTNTPLPSFTDMLNQDWSACPSPVSPMSPSPLSPSPSFSMPSTPGFEAQSPTFAHAQPSFTAQIDMQFGGNGMQKGFDYTQFNAPAYHQQQESFMSESFIGMDNGYGFNPSMGQMEQGFGMGGYTSFEGVPQYTY